MAVVVVTPRHSAHAQLINRSVEFENLGFTSPMNVGARPAGMAGAYTAIANDVHSLIYNPAGLARVKRIELSLSVEQQRREITNKFYGVSNTIDTNDGGLDGTGLVWPFPAYRGSLVAAFGVYRMYSCVFDLHYSGENDNTNTSDNYLLQQTGSVYSYNLGLAADLSPSFSGGVSVFLLDGSMSRLRQFDFTYKDWTPVTSVFVKEDVGAEVDGVGGRLGMQFFIHPLLSGGISFTTPIWIELKGSGLAEITKHYDNAVDYFEELPMDVDDSYLLPYRVDIGLAFTSEFFVASLEMGYADWTEAAINRKRLRDNRTLETIFREVFDYEFGVEVVAPWFPLRARAGFAYRPYPLAYLQADRIDENNLAKATIERERREVTFGAGGLIGNMLTVDASFSLTEGKRSVGTLVDDRSVKRLVLSAAYRF
jgi:hypothetical protein